MLSSVEGSALIVPSVPPPPLSPPGAKTREESSQTGATKILLSLVVPTFNEARNLESLVEQLMRLLEPELGQAFEIIIVDDDSPDRTWELGEQLSGRYSQVRVLRRTTERGLSTAVIRGWQVARGEVLAVMDADLQHPPEVNVSLFNEIERGADLAVGSRNITNGGVSDWSLLRRILSRGAQLFGLLLLPEVLGRVSDPMSGYFMVRRAAIAGVVLDPLGYKILVEVVARGRAKWIAETPYVFRERVLGDSKASLRQGLDYIRHLFRLRVFKLRRSRIARYALVGIVGVGIDMSLLYALSEESMLGWGIARSKLLGATVAMLSNFFLHEMWTFRHVEKPLGLAYSVRRFVAYSVVSLVGILGAVTILSLLVEFSSLNRYVANIVGIAAVAVWNYWLHRQITWAEVAPIVDPDQSPKRLER